MCPTQQAMRSKIYLTLKFPRLTYIPIHRGEAFPVFCMPIPTRMLTSSHSHALS